MKKSLFCFMLFSTLFIANLAFAQCDSNGCTVTAPPYTDPGGKPGQGLGFNDSYGGMSSTQIAALNQANLIQAAWRCNDQANTAEKNAAKTMVALGQLCTGLNALMFGAVTKGVIAYSVWQGNMTKKTWDEVSLLATPGSLATGGLVGDLVPCETYNDRAAKAFADAVDKMRKACPKP